MKKEYLILTALIAILCAYLFLHDENRDFTTLPEIPKIDTSQVTGLVIEKEGGQIEFARHGKKWVLTGSDYPTDHYIMDNMLSTFKNLRLSSLVAEKDNPGRYSLDPEHRIRVFLKKNDETIFQLDMGKTAPTFNHTFVMLDGQGGIYHAAGSFRSHFDHELDDFRDKRVLEFKAGEIKSLTVKKGSLEKALTRTPETDDQSEKEVPDHGKTDGGIWQFSDGSAADQETVNTLLSALSSLECDHFIHPEKGNSGDEIPESNFTVTLKNGKTHELNGALIQENEDKILTGTSSLNKYKFALNGFASSRITEGIEKLLGIYKEENPRED